MFQQGRLGSGDGQGHPLVSAVSPGALDAPDARFGEALYGRSMRVQSASPTMVSNAPGISSGISNSFKGAKKSLGESMTQRPHTACTPTVERHLRRYTRCMSAGNSGPQRTSTDVFSCPERPSGRFGSLSAAGELVARPGSPTSGLVSQGVLGAWSRHIRGAASDGPERRPGRSKSTEPSLLGKLSCNVEKVADAADSLTAQVKSGPRTKIKAAVDCWWDEQRLGGGNTPRSTSSSGNLGGGAKRGSLQRSHSAGQRKSQTSSSRSGGDSRVSGDRLKGSSSRSRPRSSSLTSQGRKSSSSAGKSNELTSTSIMQDKSDYHGGYEDTRDHSAAAHRSKSAGSQPVTSSSGPTNSLTLLSKLALPDTTSGYLGLGKYSLPSAPNTGNSALGDTKAGSEQGSSRPGTPVTTPIRNADPTAASPKRSMGQKTQVENASGWGVETKVESQGKTRNAAGGARRSDAEGSRTHEIMALQDITFKCSRDFGISDEWFAEFCEELVDEWESDSDDDVSDV